MTSSWEVKGYWYTPNHRTLPTLLFTPITITLYIYHNIIWCHVVWPLRSRHYSHKSNYTHKSVIYITLSLGASCSKTFLCRLEESTVKLQIRYEYTYLPAVQTLFGIITSRTIVSECWQKALLCSSVWGSMINSSKAATQLIKEEKALSYVNQKINILHIPANLLHCHYHYPLLCAS